MSSQQRLVIDHVMPEDKDGAGFGFEVKKGQIIRIIGRSTVDFVAYNRSNMKDKLDQARTKTNQLKINLTKGDVIFSRDNNVMLTITEDTWPWLHDMQKGMCSRKRHEMAFNGEIKVDEWEEVEDTSTTRWDRWEDIPQRGCWENLTNALKPWPEIDRWDIPSPFNIFQNMRIDGETGRMWFHHKKASEDAVLEMRAEMDLVIGVAHHFNYSSRIQVRDS